MCSISFRFRPVNTPFHVYDIFLSSFDTTVVLSSYTYSTPSLFSIRIYVYINSFRNAVVICEGLLSIENSRRQREGLQHVLAYQSLCAVYSPEMSVMWSIAAGDVPDLKSCAIRHT